jgi:hypothetical protein
MIFVRLLRSNRLHGWLEQGIPSDCAQIYETEKCQMYTKLAHVKRNNDMNIKGMRLL